MFKTLFRPGAGNVHQSFTTAVADAVMYPGDLVAISSTAPTSQGVSGVFGSKTLGATDFIECSLATIANGGHYGVLGTLMGKGIGEVADWTNVSTKALADQDVVIIQAYGVHPAIRQTAGVAPTAFLVPTATAGAITATATPAFGQIGIVLATAVAAQRVTAADIFNGPGFLRCR